MRATTLRALSCQCSYADLDILAAVVHDPCMMILVSLPTTSGPWITGAEVVKSFDGRPVVVRTADGTLYTSRQFVTI